MNSPIDGIYAAYLSGQMGNGFGLLLFRKGHISGADAMGVVFDGGYVEEGQSNSLSVTLDIKTPPNTVFLQGGVSGPQGETQKLQFQLPSDFAQKDFTRIETQRGPVNARLIKLRSLDE
jgi:hypothetical protein